MSFGHVFLVSLDHSLSVIAGALPLVDGFKTDFIIDFRSDLNPRPYYLLHLIITLSYILKFTGEAKSSCSEKFHLLG